MAKATHAIPAQRVALYERLVATLPGVERKGASMPYTFVNGNMFSFLAADGSLALRLPEDERETFMKEHETGLVLQHGAVLKDYVRVPDALLSNTRAMKRCFALSYAYVQTLKPKATKKR